MTLAYGDAGYDAHARARHVTEPPKPQEASRSNPAARASQSERIGRSPFQRDRARVLHSAAFRRLAAKTQVHTAGEDDFPRTRLTHSLEVAQIAREMGAELGCDADIVDTAGLAHDLGHPPFGHNGEAVLDELAEGCGGFEGNAQTLRVLTRLEAKVEDPASAGNGDAREGSARNGDARGGSAGLNLTRAVLDATCKYPWPRRGERKFGVYADDARVFEWCRAGAPPLRRCLEAQVMDWADDVAYSVHDVEDGVHAGHVQLARLDDPAERAALADQVAATYSDESPADLLTLLDELLADPLLEPLAGYDASHRAQIALKRAASAFIGRFVSAAVTATRQRHGPSPLRRYTADLVVPREVRARCALLKGLALRQVMLRPGAAARYQAQRDVLSELVTRLAQRAPEALDPVFAPLWRVAADDAARQRVVVDQVASLTDASAVAWLGQLRRLGG